MEFLRRTWAVVFPEPAHSSPFGEIAARLLPADGFARHTAYIHPARRHSAREGMCVRKVVAEHKESHLAADADSEGIPYSLTLELLVKDSETIAELCRHAEGGDRDQFALNAVRIERKPRPSGQKTFRTRSKAW